MTALEAAALEIGQRIQWSDGRIILVAGNDGAAREITVFEGLGIPDNNQVHPPKRNARIYGYDDLELATLNHAPLSSDIDAPVDGAIWARRGSDRSWQPAGGGGGGPIVETDPLSVHRGGTAADRTMTGLLTLSGAPTANLHAATKAYVDAPADGQTYGRQGSTWVLTAARESFTGTVNAACIGTEAAGDVYATLTIPPANLPNRAFGWVVEGTGTGHLFVHNIGGSGQMNGSATAQVLDGGNWLNAASFTLSTAAFPTGSPTLIRGGGSAPGGTRIFQYDPAINIGGIQVRLIAGPSPSPGSSIFTFGIEAQILQYL